MNPNGPLETPTLRALLNSHLDEVFSRLNCHQLGTIVSFDKDQQTAQVKINAQRVVYNQPQTTTEGLQQQPLIVDYPILADVPVFFSSGGEARLTLPIAAGDTCLVLFNDRDFDAWWATGNVAPPNSPRMHSLSDAIAVVGVRSKANKVSDYNPTDAELKFGDSKVGIKPDGTLTLTAKGGSTVQMKPDKSITLTNAAGGSITMAADGTLTVAGKQPGQTATFKTSGQIEVLSSANARLALKEDGTAVLSYQGAKFVANPDQTVEMFSAAGGHVKLGLQVAIYNGGGSLLTALDALMAALTGWVNTGGSTPNPATVTALNAVKAQIDALLSSS